MVLMADIGLHSFPVEMTSFVGRGQELEAVPRLLRAHPLVSLVGTGGVGKTRLAFEVAEAIAGQFDDGVWLIDLSLTSDPDVVPSLIAAPFEVGDIDTGAERPLVEVLADFFAGKHVLLVVDNCEHVQRSTRFALTTLLESCPGLQVLATSRVPIEIEGEIVYRVSPLAVPDEEHGSSEAVTLFLERLELVNASFQPDDDDLAAIEAIVTQLDGLPLAIELAASRSKLLSPAQILERLSDRLRFLHGKGKGSDRHETLLATIGWSYDLLEVEEQEAMQHLSVFNGWSLEAAETFLGPVAHDLLSSLVDRSLVEVVPGAHGFRYRMLGTMRQYGLERLEESGELEQARSAHALFFLDVAEESHRKLRTAEQAKWVEKVKLEHDNIRSALGWAIDTGSGELALRLVAAMGRFWFMQTHWAEALRWYQRVTDLAKEDFPLAWARAFLNTGSIELITQGTPNDPQLVEEAYRIARDEGSDGELAMATYHLAELRPENPKELIDEAIRLFRVAGDKWGESLAKRWLGSKVELFGDPIGNIVSQREAVDGFTQIGDRWSAGWMSFDLGFSLLAVEDYEQARVAFENALDLVAGTDGRLVVAHATRGLGSVSAGLGDREEARRLFEESIPMLEQMGDTTCLAFSRMYLSDVFGQSAMADTSRLLSEAFAGFRDVNHQPGMAAVLRRLAHWVTESDPSFAARTLGAAGSLEGGVAQGLAPKEATFLGTIESSLADHLSADELRRFEEEAAGADVDSIVRQALALLTPPVRSEPDSGVGESVRDHVGRRLAAIVIADIVGFSAQVAEDEAGTHRRIQGLRDHSIEPLLAAWNGRLVKTMGDGFLCEFASAVDAVECALAWQSGIGGDSGFVFRIGVAVGDIIVEGGDVFGDGVNVAARLESLAQPGGILVAGDAYRQVKGKVRADFEDLGLKELKNIPEPVGVYQAVPTR